MNSLTLHTIIIFGMVGLFVFWGLTHAYPQ